MRRRELYDDELEPLVENTQTQPKYQWDLFNNVPRETISGSTIESKYIDLSVKYLKIFTVIFTMLIVLGCAVVSKASLLFMTSQIKPNITRLYCNENLDTRQQYIVIHPQEERTVWIWIIIFSYMVPELGTFIRSVRIISFKSWNYPTKLDFLILATTEILPVIGSALLVFIVFPEIDVIKAAMLTNGVCLVPGIVAMISRSTSKVRQGLCYGLDIAAIVIQASALVVWPLVENRKILYIIPIALSLISVGWWENFLSEKTPIPWVKKFAKAKKQFKTDVYFTYALITPIKCLIFLLSAVTIIWIREGDVGFLFDKFGDAFSSHSFNVTQVK
uniref:Chitin synthase chs-2-like n=1 Tax=Diabrotica virgifera virgifera TaxID=50390 RepID=A0A6P7FUQ3_DIAVI